MLGTADGRQCRPGRLGSFGGLQGRGGLGGTAVRYRGHDLGSGRVLDLNGAAALDPATVDAVAVVPDAVLLGEHGMDSGQPV